VDSHRRWARTLIADLLEVGIATPDRRELAVRRFVRRQFADDLTAEELSTAATLVAAAYDVLTSGNPRSWGLARAAAKSLEPGVEDHRARIVDTVGKYVTLFLILEPERRGERLRQHLVAIDTRFGALSVAEVERVLDSITIAKRGAGALGIVRAAAQLAVTAKVEAHPTGDTDQALTKRFRKAYEKTFRVSAAKAFAKADAVRTGRGQRGASARGRSRKRTSE